MGDEKTALGAISSDPVKHGHGFDATYPEPHNGEPLSSRQMVIHLAGHLNYHLGQIDYLRRVLTGDGAISLAGLQQ